MGRSRRYLVLASAVVIFLLVSAALARVLSANGAERAAIRDALEAQASGDARALVAAIDGCAQDEACRAEAAVNAAALRSSGEIELARLDLSTSFSPFDTTGTARVVWKTPSRLTVVQCARVHRSGNVASGIEVRLTSLSRPIKRDTSCP
ncbi:hypothetical protein Q5424_05565 [Conexibacter sp. JD483]|uniref:hypothetical protein n=1 Tax=unclassified Conexibacter TaxID=2627773 RepID=UPI00272886ED|nr:MULTISPECIES: hypothetical protein [unclassified Conexibacter]MDO8185929.1 hypothetical protein [Conexibacter sp. CPCC 205706]MDO8199420.1 hypothetical protein [Conexibacter sp. CPCC 205762]MDR9368539.1 hypothetical protein [Conexibacter sp. JD483]